MGRPKKNINTEELFTSEIGEIKTEGSLEPHVSNNYARIWPPKEITSDSETPSLSFNFKGLRSNIDYTFYENGRVDWAKLIEEKYFVPNKKYFEDRNKPIPSTTEGLTDAQKLVLLAGYKSLADIRGFKSVKFISLGGGENYVRLSCEIVWNGNFETGYQDITFSSTGDGTIYNTDKFGKLYLGQMAENRAFLRNVRNFLRIPILGKEEAFDLDKDSGNSEFPEDNGNSQVTSPHFVLERKMEEKGISFERIKKRLIAEGKNEEEVNSWITIKDMPKDIVVEILGKICKKDVS